MSKRRRNLVVAVVVILLGVVLVTQVLRRDSDRKTLDLSSFESHLSNGDVRDATLYDRDHVVKGTLTNGTKYEVKFPEQYSDEITKEIRGPRWRSSTSTPSRPTRGWHSSPGSCRSC